MSVEWGKVKAKAVTPKRTGAVVFIRMFAAKQGGGDERLRWRGFGKTKREREEKEKEKEKEKENKGFLQRLEKTIPAKAAVKT